MKIEINGDVWTVEGVKFTIFVLEQFLAEPPSRVLLNVRRCGEHLEFTTYRDADSAKSFFESLK